MRQLDEDVKAALQRRARAKGRSAEAEGREILRNAVRDTGMAPVTLSSAIARRFRGTGLEVEIAVLRRHPAHAARLE